MPDTLIIARPFDGTFGVEALERFALGSAELTAAGYAIFQDGFQLSDLGGMFNAFPRAVALAAEFPLVNQEIRELSLNEGFYCGHAILASTQLALEKITALQPQDRSFAKRTLSGSRGIDSTRRFLEQLSDLTTAGYRIFHDGFQPITDIPQLIGMFPQGYALAQELSTTRFELRNLTFEDGIDVGHALLDSVKRTYTTIRSLHESEGTNSGVQE